MQDINDVLKCVENKKKLDKKKKYCEWDISKM